MSEEIIEPTGEELSAEMPESETDTDQPFEVSADAPTEEAPAEPLELAAESEGESRFALRSVVEAVLFASQKPVAAKEISNILKSACETAGENADILQFRKVREPQLRAAIEDLNQDYLNTGRAFEIRETAAGWQLVSKPEFSPWLRQLFPENRPAKLSAPGIETLAIIAYRQPITKADVEAVRGVAVDGVMQTLLDRGFVRIAGRAELPGRPLLYGTTQHFLDHFGFKGLEELPNADELRKLMPSLTPVEPASAPESSTETTEIISETPAPDATASETAEAMPPVSEAEASAETEPTIEATETLFAPEEHPPSSTQNLEPEETSEEENRA